MNAQLGRPWEEKSAGIEKEEELGVFSSIVIDSKHTDASEILPPQ